jgi:hypothetical protein
MVFESLLAPIAFAVIVVAVIVWAFARRARRRVSDVDTETTRPSTDRVDSEHRRRYG